jgi:hypothetical protein
VHYAVGSNNETDLNPNGAFDGGLDLSSLQIYKSAVPAYNVARMSSASTVTFSSISQSYRDLVLVFLGKGTSAGNFALRANSDSSSSYTLVRIFNNGNTPASGSGTESYFYVGGVGTTLDTLIKVDLFDYVATDKHKTALTAQDIGGDTTMRIAARWPSTAAITTLNCSLTAGSFASGSSFALYGVK